MQKHLACIRAFLPNKFLQIYLFRFIKNGNNTKEQSALFILKFINNYSISPAISCATKLFFMESKARAKVPLECLGQKKAHQCGAPKV